ncbi:hypothetical protein C0J52_17970 [Blattella germanica]|nr:hypothetical protein C0J52_17970 [Blattella germanica]
MVTINYKSISVVDNASSMANISVLYAGSNLKAMPKNWYEMAAIMNLYCENDGIEEVCEAECASLVGLPERSKLR